MKYLYMLVLLVFFEGNAFGQELFFGFFGENSKLYWECRYDSEDGRYETLKDELLASLGANAFVRLSPSQPSNKIVGRVEGMPARFKGLDNLMTWTYDFGFSIIFTESGYIVKGSNFLGKTNNGGVGNYSSAMTAEEWLGSNGKSRQKKWCEAVGVPATEIFQIP